MQNPQNIIDSIPSADFESFKKKFSIPTDQVLNPVDFDYYRVLGEGAYGKVRKCIEKKQRTDSTGPSEDTKMSDESNDLDDKKGGERKFMSLQ